MTRSILRNFSIATAFGAGLFSSEAPTFSQTNQPQKNIEVVTVFNGECTKASLFGTGPSNILKCGREVTVDTDCLARESYYSNTPLQMRASARKCTHPKP